MSTDPVEALRVTLAKLTKQASPLARGFLADLPVVLDQYIEHTEARIRNLEGTSKLVPDALGVISNAKREGQL